MEGSHDAESYDGCHYTATVSAVASRDQKIFREHKGSKLEGVDCGILSQQCSWRGSGRLYHELHGMDTDWKLGHEIPVELSE